MRATGPAALAVPAPVLACMERLRGAGYRAYVVGGGLRDALLGREAKDYDLATDATPQRVGEVFGGMPVIPTGLGHGTVTLLSGGMPIEITTFRVEQGYTDLRRPDRVTFTGSLREDLARRDFTVNALAWAPGEGLLDYVGGLEDLRAGCIRCVGQPARRFGEDALRLLRGLRLAAELGFSIEPDTAAALRACRGLIAAVSRERVQAELARLLLAPGMEGILKDFGEVLAAALPGLEPPPGQGDWGQAVARAAAMPPSLPLRWAALLLGRGGGEGVLATLRLDSQTLRRTLSLLPLGQAHPPADRIGIKEALRGKGLEAVEDWLAFHRALAPGEGGRACALLVDILARGDCWRRDQLAVSGEDLLPLAQGRELGRLLDALLGEVVAERLPNRREVLLAAAHRWLKTGCPGD